MIKSKPGKQFAAASQALCLQVLTDDPGDNTYGHTPLHIQTGDGKRYIVLFAGHPVVIAGVGYRIDAIGEAHIDNALVDICDTAGILALDTALLQVVPVGVLGNTLDVSLDAQVLQTVAPHAENTDQNLIAYGKRSWASPIQSQARSRARIEVSTPKTSTRTTFSATAITRAWTMRPS